jgi:bacillithiol biosynthesis cysteine-adding enzyme BshC
MTATCIPYTHVPHTSLLLSDYLYHFDRLSSFYNGSPYQLQSYQNVASQVRKWKFDREIVCNVLAEQNRAFGCGEVTLGNIERLRRPETFAVVTGQQVGLFSGPVFTLYKALTTVKLAQYLNEQGIPSVPVFWLATEDHDLEEVAETFTFDEEYRLLRLHDAGARPSAKSQVGVVRHTEAVTAAIDQLEAALPPGESRTRLVQDLRDCYKPGATWGESFGKFLTRLFSKWGVILLDPMDQALHRLSAGVYRRAFQGAAALRKGLIDRSRDLVKSGYHAQVHIAEDSTLLFVNHHGDRVPLDQRGEKFFLGEQEIAADELESLARNRPLDFSPNVLLRPLVQDTLLPTITYVAGPSELAYWGQGQAIYHAFGRPQPVVFPRAAFTLVDVRTDRLLEKYKISVEDVWQGEEVLGRKIAAVGFAGGWSERFDQSERELDALLARLRADIEKLDPTLVDTLTHTQEKVKFQIEKLRGKLTRSALSRSELLTRHVALLSQALLPDRDLQERKVGGAYYLGRVGYELLDRVLAQVQVHCSDHQVLKLEAARPV